MTNKLQLFFDIDETLVNVPQKATPLEVQTFFRTYGCIIDVRDMPHYVFPGVRELMRLLLIDFSDCVEVVFFSAGEKWRNDMLVPLLLKEALGEQTYRHLNPKPLVFSRDNMTQVTQDEMRIQAEQYQLPPSWGTKKDLLALYPDIFTSDNMILIDDGAWNIAPGQEGNFLCGIRTTVESYRACPNTVFEASFLNSGQYREINSIYYITGLLLECIERYQSERLSAYLFNLQFNPVGYLPAFFNAFDSERFKPCFKETQERAVFYDEGLKRLQVLNADLNFHTAIPCAIPDQHAITGFTERLLADFVVNQDKVDEETERRRLRTSKTSCDLASMIDA